MTVTQAAERIGVFRQRVSVLAHEGRIRGVMIGKMHPGRGVWALSPESVEAFKREHEQRMTQSKTMSKGEES